MPIYHRAVSFRTPRKLELDQGEEARDNLWYCYSWSCNSRILVLDATRVTFAHVS